jgi:hypothetical protein
LSLFLEAVFWIQNVFRIFLTKLGTSDCTLREEHKQRVFENRVLRGIFGRKRKMDHGENCIK